MFLTCAWRSFFIFVCFKNRTPWPGMQRTVQEWKVVMERMALRPREAVVAERGRCAPGRMMLTVVSDSFVERDLLSQVLSEWFSAKGCERSKMIYSSCASYFRWSRRAWFGWHWWGRGGGGRCSWWYGDGNRTSSTNHPCSCPCWATCQEETWPTSQESTQSFPC